MTTGVFSDLRRPRRPSRSLYVIAGGLAVLVAAWVWLAIEHRTLSLWHVIVHESGAYTFGQTVLYARHFLREIPTLISVSLFVVAAYGVPAIEPTERSRARRWAPFLAASVIGAGLMVVGAFEVVAERHGTTAAWRNLLQFHTRDDMSAYGSHWRFHWLSTLWLGLATSLCATVAARWFGAPAPNDTDSRRLLGAIAWGWFFGLSIVFVPTHEPFLDPRYIGHQAREILTHSLVTLPIGLAILAGLLRLHRANTAAARPSRIPIGAACVCIIIPVYLGLATVFGDALAHGQTAGGFAAMVAAHFFEHAMDYAFVALLCIGGYGLLLGRAARR